jgi:nucleoside-diphosphate-sugar epimerase
VQLRGALRRAGVGLGNRRGDRASERRGDAQPAPHLRRRLGQAAGPFQHQYGYPGAPAIEETYACTRFRNWYAQTKLDAEAEVRRAAAAHELSAVVLRPATVYGPRSTDVIGGIGRPIRDGHMLLIDGGRAVAGLCFIENLMDAALLALRHEAAPGHAFNVTDGLDITWRQFTNDLARKLGSGQVRWSVPYWMANGIGFSLEHGYRMLRKATRLQRPRCSRARPSTSWAAARTSATAKRVSCSDGAPASSTRPGSPPRSTG